MFTVIGWRTLKTGVLVDNYGGAIEYQHGMIKKAMCTWKQALKKCMQLIQKQLVRNCIKTPIV